MADEVQRRLTDAVERMQASLSRSHFRPMMKQVHSCSLKCYDNNNASDEQIANCEQNCMAHTQAYKQVFEREMGSFQNRLQRGASECQDAAQDRVTDSVRSDPQQMSKVQAEMDRCVSACVDKHISMLPGVQKRIESQIEKFGK